MALSYTNATAATMRAVMYHGIPFNVTVEDRPIPVIQNSTDAIIRVSHAAICGSDLHFYRFPGDNSFSVGHEAVGWIERIGTGVNLFNEGDWVSVPDNLGEPTIYNVEFGETVAPNQLLPGLGIEGLEGYQAEHVRVPYADHNLIPLPIPRNTTNSTQIIPYLFTSDIWATAWAAVTWSGFEAGDTVAVFGAGPVGLLATYSAFLRGASKVYTIDYSPQRLAIAESLGAIPINFNDSSPVDQILAYEPGGVIRSLDCVGFEALNTTLQHDDGAVLRDAVAITANGGGIGQIGVYQGGGNNATLNDGLVDFPVAEFFSKGITYRSGIVDVRDFSQELVRLISSGEADPTFIVSAIIGIEQAPEYYQKFSDHEETKVVIEFPW